MKNYIIGFLMVCLLVLGTYFYKESSKQVLDRFPIDAPPSVSDEAGPPLYLYVFFSRNNCPVCMEALQVLNTLRAPFVVTGVIPTNELKDETEFRRLTGVTFRLIPFNRLHKPFKPNYAPAIYGVSAAGKVLFILPGVPEQQDYLYNLLVNFYGKSRTHLIPGGRKKNGDGG